MTSTHHDSDHPQDRTIPIVLAGGRVVRTTFGIPSNLVDVPATVLHALGVAVPKSYAGRPLVEAFIPAPGVAESPTYAAAP